MLPLTILRTLNGPIPTLFTGDPTHAVQFIQDLARLVWTNPDHPLISTPWTRIDLALAFISGPTTLAWRRSIRCGRPTETDIDALWQDFLESFCETWVHSPESTISAVAPAVQISTASVPSPSLAAASTLKQVEDISIILPADELPPRFLSETIDQTADEDETDDWSSFAPCTSAPPPISPSSSPFDRVSPIDEPPRTPFQACGQAIPVTTPVKVDDGETLVTSPHASDGITRKRKNETNGEDDTRPGKRIQTQLERRRIPLPWKYSYVQRCPAVSPPPVDDSSGLFTPARLHPSSPPARPTKPHRVVLRDATPLQLPLRSFPTTVGLATDVECEPADLAFVTPVSHPHLPSHSVSPSPRAEINAISLSSPSPRFPDLFSPPLSRAPDLLPAYVLSSPAVRTASTSGIRIPSPPVLACHRTPFSDLKKLSPDSPLISSLAVNNVSPAALPENIAQSLDDLDEAPGAVLLASPPPSSSVAPALFPVRPPISVVEDDNLSRRGVKTIENSVLVPLASRYPPIFPPKASERPRETDELAGQTRVVHSGHTTRLVSPLNDIPSATSPRHTLKWPCDPDEPVTECVHAQPRQTRSRRTDRHISDERPPDTDAVGQRTMYRATRRRPTTQARSNAKPNGDKDARRTTHTLHRRPRIRTSQTRNQTIDKPVNHGQKPDVLTQRLAVDKFLKNYDVLYPSKKTTPKPPEPEYDAVMRHLDYRLRTNDVLNCVDPFHYTVLQLATMGPDGTQPRSIYRSAQKKKATLFEDE